MILDSYFGFKGSQSITLLLCFISIGFLNVSIVINNSYHYFYFCLFPKSYTKLFVSFL
jgi:hypothetical protein